MKLIQAKVTRLLTEPMLNKQLRANHILATLAVGIAKGNDFKIKKQKLNQIVDSLISKFIMKGEDQ